jgi:flagellar basal body-associated protein FliL
MADETVSEQSGGGGGRLTTVLMLLNILATGALGFFVFMNAEQIKAVSGKLEEKQKEEANLAKNNAKLTAEEVDSTAMGPLVDLGVIRVNLRGADGRDYRLQTSLSLEVDSPETQREAESKIVPIRYSLHKLLSSRRPEEVIGSEQMELVRSSMARNADAMLASKTGKVVNVWPNDWIVE